MQTISVLVSILALLSSCGSATFDETVQQSQPNNLGPTSVGIPTYIGDEDGCEPHVLSVYEWANLGEVLLYGRVASVSVHLETIVPYDDGNARVDIDGCMLDASFTPALEVGLDNVVVLNGPSVDEVTIVIGHRVWQEWSSHPSLNEHGDLVWTRDDRIDVGQRIGGGFYAASDHLSPLNLSLFQFDDDGLSFQAEQKSCYVYPSSVVGLTPDELQSNTVQLAGSETELDFFETRTFDGTFDEAGYLASHCRRRGWVEPEPEPDCEIVGQPAGTGCE